MLHAVYGHGEQRTGELPVHGELRAAGSAGAKATELPTWEVEVTGQFTGLGTCRATERAVATRDLVSGAGCLNGPWSQLHYSRFFARGGGHRTPNLLTLCIQHCRQRHEGNLVLRGGDAELHASPRLPRKGTISASRARATLSQLATEGDSARQSADHPASPQGPAHREREQACQKQPSEARHGWNRPWTVVVGK